VRAQRAAWSCGLCLAVLSAFGCGSADRQAPTAAGGADARPADGGGRAGAGEGGAGVEPLVCDEPQPGPSPLLRLNTFQLGNTLRELFQRAPATAQYAESTVLLLPPQVDPFSNELSSAAQEVPRASVERYHQLAHDVALRLSEDAEQLHAFIECDPSAEDALICRDRFLDSFLQSAYRRPASAEERQEMQAVFAKGEGLGGGFASGVRAVVEVVLQGPDFLYLIERGTSEARGGAVPLTGYETAARVAYALTGSAPDAELRTSAQDGPLTAQQIEAHARRLLGGLPSRSLTRDFMNELLGLDAAGSSSTQAPSYTLEIAALTRQESARFIEEVVFDGAGTFQALLAQPSTWLNGPLAQFYGVPGVTGDAFQRVEIGDGRRAGLLTQSAFLNVTSPGGSVSPVARGLTVLRRVLCVTPAPPPMAVPVLPPASLENATRRQRLEASTAPPPCQECHRYIDPIGFAFDNYDAAGLWRDTEAGLPIDASGTLQATDAQGGFENAVQLVQRIAESQDAQRCFARNWLTYAYARPVTVADACARQQVEAALLESGGNIVEMLVALAKTDHLRYRLASELTP
jgi:hypothetical protein